MSGRVDTSYLHYGKGMERYRASIEDTQSRKPGTLEPLLKFNLAERLAGNREFEPMATLNPDHPTARGGKLRKDCSGHVSFTRLGTQIDVFLTAFEFGRLLVAETLVVYREPRKPIISYTESVIQQQGESEDDWAARTIAYLEHRCAGFWPNVKRGV